MGGMISPRIAPPSAPAIQKTFAFRSVELHAHVLDGFQIQAYSCKHEYA